MQTTKHFKRFYFLFVTKTHLEAFMFVLEVKNNYNINTHVIMLKGFFYFSNNVVRRTAKLFSVSDEFRRLCTNMNVYTSP